jgi:hypothetical protein
MFGLFKKKKPEPSALYDTLFGDVPLAQSQWNGASTFDEVRALLERKDKPRAQQRLQELLADARLESRQHLQAWHFLRELDVQPGAAEARQVLGVVLEVALENGNDTLAAYRDGSARLSSHSGKQLVWESRDPQVDAIVDQLLGAGQPLAENIPPWTEPRRAPPTNGSVRVSVLTPSGLHFGEGPFAALARDPLASPIITTGAKLMGALISRAGSR